MWLNCLPSLMTSSNNLPSTSDLECDQTPVYFLNMPAFATWKSYGSLPLVQISEFVLLSSSSSSRQFQCEHLQLHLKISSIMYKNWHAPKQFVKKQTCHDYWEYDLFHLWTWKNTSTRHSVFWRSHAPFCSKTLSCLSMEIHLRHFSNRHQ